MICAFPSPFREAPSVPSYLALYLRITVYVTSVELGLFARSMCSAGPLNKYISYSIGGLVDMTTSASFFSKQPGSYRLLSYVMNHAQHASFLRLRTKLDDAVEAAFWDVDLVSESKNG